MYRYIVYCAGGGALQAGYWERAVIAFGQSRNSPSRSAFFIRIQRADRRFNDIYIEEIVCSALARNILIYVVWFSNDLFLDN